MAAFSSIDPRITRWLEGLVSLTIAGTGPVSPERITLMAAMLAADGFPAEAFSFDSLHHTAQGQRFFPAYDDVRKALHGWWDAHRPAAALQIAGPGLPELDATDRHWLAYWHRRRAEIATAGGGHGPNEAVLERLASLVRSRSPAAWAAISGREPVASRAPTLDEAVHVARLLRPEPMQRSAAVPPEPAAPPPFRDVTAKGEALAKLRASTRRVPA